MPQNNAVITSGVVLEDINKKLATVESVIEEVSRKEQSLYIMVLSVFFVVASAGAIFITRGLSNRLNNLVIQVTNIAEGDGDLRQQITIQNDDEIGALGAAINTFISSLRIMVIDVKTAVKDIESSTADLGCQTDNIASSMAVQLQETEMVATAVNEMSSTSQNVAGTASQTAQTTESTNH